MFRRLTKAMLGVALLAMASHAAPAKAAPINLLLTYAESGGGGMTGSGSVTFDASLLAPNLFTNEAPNGAATASANAPRPPEPAS